MFGVHIPPSPRTTHNTVQGWTYNLTFVHTVKAGQAALCTLGSGAAPHLKFAEQGLNFLFSLRSCTSAWGERGELILKGALLRPKARGGSVRQAAACVACLKGTPQVRWTTRRTISDKCNLRFLNAGGQRRAPNVRRHIQPLTRAHQAGLSGRGNARGQRSRRPLIGDEKGPGSALGSPRLLPSSKATSSCRTARQFGRSRGRRRPQMSETKSISRLYSFLPAAEITDIRRSSRRATKSLRLKPLDPRTSRPHAPRSRGAGRRHARLG